MRDDMLLVFRKGVPLVTVKPRGRGIPDTGAVLDWYATAYGFYRNELTATWVPMIHEELPNPMPAAP